MKLLRGLVERGSEAKQISISRHLGLSHWKEELPLLYKEKVLHLF